MKKELGIFEKHLQIPMRIEKKKKRRANEGTLLEQIVRMFLVEAPESGLVKGIEFYAYDTDNKRLQIYTTTDGAKDAIATKDNRTDPRVDQSPEAKAALGRAGFDDRGQRIGEPDDDQVARDIAAFRDAEKEDEPEEEKKTGGILSQAITKLRDTIFGSRSEGEAGAGGIKASWGEVQYGIGVNTNFAEFRKDNDQEIKDEIERINGRKHPARWPTAEEERTLRGIGLDPDSDEAKEYIAEREVWARQRVEEVRGKKTFTKGFGGKDEAALLWARSAFDGALTTQALLRESGMDVDSGYQAHQSTTKLDDMVADSLRQSREDCEGDKACEEHYDHELELFETFREFHDTYVVGQDKDGRTYIVVVSNKKGSDLKDIQANTTPRSRFLVVKRALGPDVAREVEDAIEEGIRIVTEVQDTSITSVADTEATPVTSDFATVAELAAKKQIKALSTRAGDNKRKRKAGTKSKEWPRGVPATHDEFGCWLEDQDISAKDFEGMTTEERLKLTQGFMGDTTYHEALGKARDYVPPKTYKPPYEMARIWTKVGELRKGSHNETRSIRKQLGAKWERMKKDPSIERAREIKETEQDAVKEAHDHVVNALETADYPDGREEGDTNGENVQGYIASAMGAMHTDLYIRLPEKDDDRIIQQMGTHGVKPSHVRGCLAELSGYDLKDTKESREGLIQHLRKTCVLDPTTGAIVVKTQDKEHSLMGDSWRTAGLDQKVDSTYGDSMRDCLQDRSARTQMENASVEELRPLLRSLIVRELDRIKNGN